MDLETGIRLWRWGNGVSCVGVAQFLCLTVLAMTQYPGGTLMEENTVGYSLGENFLSDLGRTVSWSGEPNTTAALLFNTAVVVLGLSIIPFFFFLPLHAPDKSQVLWVAGLFGVGSSLALVGIGLTPYDVRFDAHHTALFFWVVFLLAAVVLHVWALLTSEESSALFGVLSFGLVAVIVWYLLQGMEFFLASRFRLAPPGDSTAFVEFVTTQKYVVLAAVGWYLIFGVRMVCTTRLQSVGRNVPLDWEAEEHLRQIQRGK